jgi:hypothetical protein
MASTLRFDNWEDSDGNPVASAATGVGAGIILQVVSVTKADTFSTTSGSFIDVTGLSATITPSSSSSKIMVFVNVLASNQQGSGSTFTITDSANSILLQPTSPGSRIVGFAARNDFSGFSLKPLALILLHSPATALAFTYKVRASTQSNTTFVNRSWTDTDNTSFMRGVSTLTLMEVAG